MWNRAVHGRFTQGLTLTPGNPSAVRDVNERHNALSIVFLPNPDLVIVLVSSCHIPLRL